MPHRIIWTINYKANNDAEHILKIILDPTIVREGLNLTSNRNFSIRFPKAKPFGDFTTKWRSPSGNIVVFPPNWGEEPLESTKERFYRIDYYLLYNEIHWDFNSTIDLEVSAVQTGAWLRYSGAYELELNEIKITPPADGEIRVCTPVPRGWARFCEKIVFHLGLGSCNKFDPLRLPIIDSSDTCIVNERECSVRFPLSSKRGILELGVVKVRWSRGLVYGWLTGEKAIFKILGVLAALIVLGFFIIQLVP